MKHKTSNEFFTADGTEVPSVITDQMREIDRIAIEETGPNLFQMMENAGRNLALLAIELLGNGWEKAKLIVLAGTGGNGGGGICAARHFANRNIDVKLCITNPDRLGNVPAFQRKIFQHANGKELEFETLQQTRFDLILDAIIGYSLQSAPRGKAAKLIRWANAANTPVLSLDVPSGVDATTGENLGESIQPDWTMTLALPKTGLISGNVGKLFLADIGIPEETYYRVGLKYTNPFKNKFWLPLT